MTRVITSNALESINFMKAAEGVRVQFMPHSPGVYIALVLKNADEIDNETVLNEKDMNVSDTLSSLKHSQSGPAVKRLVI